LSESHVGLKGEEPRFVAVAAADNCLRSARLKDASVQAAMQPWIGMKCLQLSSGLDVADFKALDLGDQQVVRERQHVAVQKFGTTPVNMCTISYCTPAPGFRFSNRRSAGAADIFLMPENTPFDLYVPAGAQTTYVSLDQRAFLRSARALNPRHWEKTPQHVTAFLTQHQTAFGDMVDGWFSAASTTAARGQLLDKPAVSRNIFESVLRLVSASTEDDWVPPAGWCIFRICRKAKAFVEQCQDAGKLPTVADLCAAAGVSERTLQYAFQDYVGMSPVAYLRLCRLNDARAALLRGDPQTISVTNVAMQFNFEHLGRFAGDYKRLFGEAPSATLAR